MINFVVQLVSHAQLSDPRDCSTPGSSSSTISWSLLKFMSVESVMPSNSSSAISFFFCVINNCYHRHHHHHHHHRCRPASCHASEPADGTLVAQRAVSIAENRPLTGRNGPWALAARSTGKPLSYLQLHKSVFVKFNTSFGINKRVVNYKPIPFKCKRKHSRNTKITKEKRLFPAVSHFRFESLII